MNNTLFVRRLETGRDLAGVLHRRLHRQRPFQVLAFDQLHHQRALLDAVDRGEIGMVQRSQNLRLAFEAGHASVIFGESGREDFDGDVAIELGIGGAINSAHAALTELGDDSVMADGLLRAHPTISGMVSLSGRMTHYSLVACAASTL